MNERRLELGIFLVSASILLTELLLTRIFSVTLYYHLSFMVVSLAMLGFGASGVAVSAWPSWFSSERAPARLAMGSLALAIGTVLAVGACFRVAVPFDFQAFDVLRVASLFVACALPFFAGGVVVSIILAHDPARAHRLYFADLVGAAVGCMVFVPATDRLGAPTAVLAAAAVAALAGVVLAGRQAPWPRRIAMITCAALVVIAAANRARGFYDIRYVKGAAQPRAMALEWNSFSRVDVPGDAGDLYNPRPAAFAGYSSRLHDDTRVQEAWLRYDADAATQITRFTGNLARLSYLDFDVSSAAFQTKKPTTALVLGSGGGRDVLTALFKGATNVTAVEINPITIRLMRSRFRTFSGGLYDGYPGVRVVNDDARAFLARDENRYDVIEASLVDTWAASAAGAYALTENSLYTVEAFDDYLAHLAPDGIAAFNRWFTEPAVESLRVVSLARAALLRAGTTEPSAHLFVVATDPRETGVTALGSILMKRSPFTAQEIDTLRTWADDMAFVVAYSPDDRARGVPANEFHRMLGSAAEHARMMRESPYDLSAVTDDRPFFFSRVPLLAWLASKTGLKPSPLAGAPLGLGGRTLGIALATSAAFTALLMLVPVLLMRRRASISRTGARSLRGLALYFGALGVGFMLVEVVLIQRFSAFLGHASYALTVVLFTMLLASGAGSLVGAARDTRTVTRALTTLVALLTVYALVLPYGLGATRGTELWFRVVLSIVVVAPAGLLMGIAFPFGLRRLRGEPVLVPWAWAVNGGASVLGSSITILVSMSFGFTAAMLLGAVCYGAVIAVMHRLPAEVS